MKSLGGTFAVVALSGWLLPQPASADSTAVKADGARVSEMSDIEDASLAALLDLDLEEQMGETEAASRTRESVLRAPAAVTTLDAQQIRLSGATSLPDVLRSVPGVAVLHNAPGNNVVSLRGTGGLASNNLILLIDGIPLNSPLDGTVSWDLVPVQLEDIERIEVVRGPVSPVYGANAYTGVVNIVTRSSQVSNPGYVARLRAGSDLEGGSLAAASGRFLHLGKDFEFKWFANAERDGRYADPASPRGGLDTAGVPARRVGMASELKLKAGEHGWFSVEGGQSWSRRSELGHLVLGSDPQVQRLFFGQARYELRNPHSFLSGLQWWVRGVSVQTDVPQPDFVGFSFDGAKSVRGVTGLDLTLSHGDWLTAQLGVQGAVERIEASFVHPNASGALRPTYGGYAGLKANVADNLDLILTVRGDLAPIATEFEYSYRASAVYHRDAWGLRLTAASAFRTPTYVEATGRFVDPESGLILLEGTDSINSPRNTTLELGGSFSPDSRLILSATLYASRLSNLMIEDFESVVRRTFRNDPDPRTFVSAELEATWRVNDALSLLPSLTVFEWIEASERIDTNVGVPSQNSQFLASLRMQGLLDNETWGYGLGVSVASSRNYDVRTGIPPIVLSERVPPTTFLSGTLEHQLLARGGLWGSLRLNASLPGQVTESPLPEASPLGQSAILGIELRRE